MNLAMIEASRKAGYPGAVRAAIWFTTVHVGAVAGIWYAFVYADWRTLTFSALQWALRHVAITCGNHRLYSHRTYEAHKALQVFFLLLTAAIIQKSTLWWAWMHRRHHTYSDTALDPYSITHGRSWSHIVWVLFAGDDVVCSEVADLAANRLVIWQHDHYYPLAFGLGLGLPVVVAGFGWGDWIGGLLIGGALCLSFQYHSTFCINSVAHWFGTRRYTKTGTAYTNAWLAPFTMEEAYHEAHHLAEDDYRLGRRWYDWRPGTWFIFFCSKVGLAWNLKHVPEEVVLRRAALAEAKAAQAP